MNLGFCPLASSSSGNCYLIKSDSTNILLDAGLSGLKIYDSLKTLKIEAGDIDGVLLTHEHGDHIRSIGPLAKRSPKAVFAATEGTLQGIGDKAGLIPKERLKVVHRDETFNIGDIEVTVFEVSHDAAEPVAYSFSKEGKKIAVVSDTGIVTERIAEAIKDADILALEANHEVNILLYGRYPYHIKRRILSDDGHLSNEAAGECLCRFLESMTESKIPRVFLTHISKENNTPEQAVLTVSNILEEAGFYVGRHLSLDFVRQNEMGQLIMI